MVPIAKAKYNNSIKRKNSTNITNESIKNKSIVNKKLVNLIKLSDFINDVVANRIVPLTPSDKSGKDIKPPTVLMKIDIEGSELEVVSDLLFAGSLQHIDAAIIEWHQHIMKDFTYRKKTNWVSFAKIYI